MGEEISARAPRQGFHAKRGRQRAHVLVGSLRVEASGSSLVSLALEKRKYFWAVVAFGGELTLWTRACNGVEPRRRWPLALEDCAPLCAFLRAPIRAAGSAPLLQMPGKSEHGCTRRSR